MKNYIWEGNLKLASVITLGSSFTKIFKMSSILGAAVVIIGLYLLLWGKEEQKGCSKSQDRPLSCCDEQKETMKRTLGSVESKITASEP